jgi:mannitol/fructose-specific phosphotransferase system IIA component (Ntr-type)
MYQPFEAGFDLQLKPEWIVYSSAVSFHALLREMLDRLVVDYPSLEVTKILDRLIRMEEDYSSVIGKNVALPHTYIDGIDTSLVMAGKTSSPLDVNGEEVMLVFLVLSPKNQPDVHIRALSGISKFIMNEENHKKLMAASSHDDLVSIFSHYPGC